MDLGLKDKVVLVTAASHGLGRGVALAFAREGAKIAICSRDEHAIAEAADEARGHGGEVLSVRADVTDPDDITRLVEQAVEQFGGIDILVSNAGGPPAGTFDRFDDGDWQAAFELTMMSAVRLIRAVLPSMKARGGGTIIAMTSSSIKQPIPNLLLSNVMRAGVAGLAKSLADELAGDNIRVNTIVPGRIGTRRIEQLDQANAERQGIDVELIREQQLRSIPMRRYGEVEEFADGVVFLASGSASYITGATLQVDGGLIRSLW